MSLTPEDFILFPPASIAGVSRSVTITVAYLMSVTDHNWRECLRAVKQAREVANPNFGFQKQLQNFENTELEEVRNRTKGQIEVAPGETWDRLGWECRLIRP